MKELIEKIIEINNDSCQANISKDIFKDLDLEDQFIDSDELDELDELNDILISKRIGRIFETYKGLSGFYLYNHFSPDDYEDEYDEAELLEDFDEGVYYDLLKYGDESVYFILYEKIY